MHDAAARRGGAQTRIIETATGQTISCIGQPRRREYFIAEKAIAIPSIGRVFGAAKRAHRANSSAHARFPFPAFQAPFLRRPIFLAPPHPARRQSCHTSCHQAVASDLLIASRQYKVGRAPASWRHIKAAFLLASRLFCRRQLRRIMLSRSALLARQRGTFSWLGKSANCTRSPVPLPPAWRHVSGKNTIGASSPLAPCTVIMRTAPPPRFHIAFNVLATLLQPMDKALQAGGMARFISQSQTQQFVQRIVNFRAQALRSVIYARPQHPKIAPIIHKAKENRYVASNQSRR